LSTPTSAQESTSPRIDPEVVARRVNGAVAADMMAIELREAYRRRSTEPDPQAIFRRIEAIEAAIYQLHVQVEELAT